MPTIGARTLGAPNPSQQRTAAAPLGQLGGLTRSVTGSQSCRTRAAAAAELQRWLAFTEQTA